MTSLIILRLIHILFGAFWVGTATFMAFFLIPSLRGDPQTLGKVGQAMNARGVHKWLGIAAVLTLLSGLWMLWIVSGGDIATYARTRHGHGFTTAGGLAILAFLGGLFFARPAGLKAGELGAKLAAATDPAEKQRLAAEVAAMGKRAGIAGAIVVSLLILAVAGMAVSRYL
jgi:uncharacterized membrane protein